MYMQKGYMMSHQKRKKERIHDVRIGVLGRPS
jgi:hypothetical protein